MSSIGNDLAAIRKHKGYSIQDVHEATRIPIHTIQTIEDGTIFTDSNEITTYVRSFVRTYGRAIKLSDSLLTEALDQEEVGEYDHKLLDPFPELSEKAEDEKSTSSYKDEEKESTNEKPAGKTKGWRKSRKKSKAPSFTFEEEKASSGSSKSAKSEKPGSADVRNIDWSKIGSGGRKSRRSTPPVWLLSTILVIILIISGYIIISQFGLFSDNGLFKQDEQNLPESEEMEEPVGMGNQDLPIELSDQSPGETSGEELNPALEDTLFLTVYAAYERLDPVRVWSDLKRRIDPYWIEQGTALNFEFQDTIRVSGNYSNMLLFFNGNRIESFRSLYYNDQENAVELTRTQFTGNPQWATPVPFDLPDNVAEPDTVRRRPSFY